MFFPERSKEKKGLLYFKMVPIYFFFFQWYRGCSDITEGALGNRYFFPIAAKRAEVKLLSAKIVVHENMGNHHLS